MKKKIKFFDATLRDGSHYIKHQFSEDFISRYCKDIDEVGLDAVVIGHGNGIGASSIQIGLSKCTDEQMLTTGKSNLKKTKLGAYMIPGLGTIEDNIIPAIKCGVQLFKIGCHCTECDTTKQHIMFLADKGIEVYGCLMMSHMVSASKLLEQTLKMQEYGANGVILFDSAGAYLPNDVENKVKTLVNGLNIEVGFHAHNNLGLAIANSLVAIDNGATIIDGTVKGFGAGAGNCQIDAIIPILKKKGIETGMNYYKLLDIADKYIEGEMKYQKGISSLSIISGISGVFSAFNIKVREAAERFGVDPRDIFIELGKRKVVGGQEDIIIDVAMNLAQQSTKDETSYIMESLL